MRNFLQPPSPATFLSSSDKSPIDRRSSSTSFEEWVEVTSGAGSGIQLSWKNINAWVPATKRYFFDLVERPDPKAPRKVILENVNGTASPGELLALMGPSGSGKTTLLNILTGRSHHPVKYDGQICANERKIGGGIRKLSAYVQQVDLFMGTLTVREYLYFQSQLRMDHKLPKQERMRRVDQVIEELGLRPCEHTLIGVLGQLKGISGGEMKRLALASEILTNPPILFCDEPTSGLDSFMAAAVFGVLKFLASRGKTVVVTVHQPSSEMFAMFDKLLLMSEHRVAYFGPADKASDFFDRLGFPVPIHYNPADHFIEVLAIVPNDRENCENRAKMICDALDEESQLERKDSLSTPMESLKEKHFYKAPWWKQFVVVMWRTWIGTAREPQYTRVRLLQSIGLALLLGLIYLQQDLTQEGVTNINGALYLFMINLSIIGMFAVVLTFTHEMPIFLREHANQLYRVDVYYLCKTLVDVPTFIILPLIFTAIAYFMVGLYADFETFVICCCATVLMTKAAASFGYFMSATFGTDHLTIAVAPVINTVFMIFGGYFLNVASVPRYWIWVQYVSWYRYSNEALMIIQWRNIGNLTCTPGRVGCLKSGHEVLQKHNFDEDNLLMDMLLIVALIVAYRVLGFISLAIRARRRN